MWPGCAIGREIAPPPVLASLERAPGATEANFDATEPFLEAVRGAPATRSRSLGVGDDVRLSGTDVGGCALVDEQLVHLTAFPAQREGARQ